MKLYVFHTRITKSMKFLKIQYRIPKIMKIELVHARITKNIKFIEFHAIITKKNETLIIACENHETQ